MVEIAIHDRLPPHDIEAEEAVIATGLVAPEQIPLLAAIVKPEHFFREKNAWVWEAMLCVYARDSHDGVNQITVAHELARGERLEEIGGVAYLSRLIGDLPTVVGFEFYAEIVRRDATYRSLITIAGQIAQAAYEAPAQLSEVLANSSDLLNTVIKGGVIDALKPLSYYIDADMMPVHKSGVLTGWPRLNYILDALRKGGTYVLAARTGRGKSSFMLNLVRDSYYVGNKSVAVFSLEMSGVQLKNRIISCHTSIDSRRIEHLNLTDAEDRMVNLSRGELAPPGVWIADSDDRIAGIESAALAHHAKYGFDLMVLDHIQLVRVGGGRSPYERVTEVSRRIKALALKLNTPILVLCQLRRGIPGSIPVLEDLRDSGAIEQDADAVLFLHDGAALPNSAPHDVSLIVAKHRHGITGAVKMVFHPACCMFKEIGGDDVL